MRVSRKIRNLMRRERRAIPTPELSPKKGSVQEKAEDLWQEYQSQGATWAACVQAVKTNWIAQFRAKYR